MKELDQLRPKERTDCIGFFCETKLVQPWEAESAPKSVKKPLAL